MTSIKGTVTPAGFFLPVGPAKTLTYSQSTMKHARAFLFAAASLFSPFFAEAAPSPSLELASPFVDGAILQRQMEVPVWGWAEPGSTATVVFGGQSKSATTDEMGKWMVHLDPLEAALDERDLVVTGAHGEIITRKGILVGEVWFSSGQSNMDWLAGKSMCAPLAAELSKRGVPIREYAVDTGSSLFPNRRAASADGWKPSKQAGNFSALSLAFAADLYQDLQVPIGILRCTHGATPVETWTAYEGFADHPKLQDIARRIRQSNPTTAEGAAAYTQYFEDLKHWQIESEALMDRGGPALPRPPLPGIADDWKGASRMYNKKIAPLIPFAIRGAIWCQGTSNAGDGKIYAAKMEALVNGWRQNWGRPDLPFYFTQMQCYGEPNPDDVGFADIREAQTLFFMHASNVGMVPQYDLNPERPTGIHYFNKLDPGKRLARWALAHEYGKDIAFTGPIYKSHTIEGNKVRVRFEQRGPGGGLLVASKGMEADVQRDPTAYVEPARETRGEPLKHFRLAGKDKVWHSAEAAIDGEEIVVTSPAVPEPVGVQYAYSASPIGANLYNTAGLPAIPFAFFEGRQMFLEDDPVIVAKAQAEAERKYGRKSYLLPSTLFRDHAVIQRDLPVPVWGHGVPGTEMTVKFGGQEKKTIVGEFEYWQVALDPLPASETGRDLQISCNNGEARTIKDVLVGDVWILTGTKALPSELIRTKAGESPPEALPLVREFRIKTNARRFLTPRKLKMEIGGGKYVSSWQNMDFQAEGDPPSMAAYHFASQVRQTGVPVGIVTLGAENPPLTWVSLEGMQKAVGFEKERDELNLAYPNTEVCKKAVVAYIETLRQHHRELAILLKEGKEIPVELADQAPPFPQPYYNEWASRTETATHTYNFCISPLTPFAVRGVLWIPDKDNIPEDVSRYAPSLKVYADSLSETYGQEKVPFFYAQPAGSLVDGIGKPEIGNAVGLNLTEWPKSLQDIATRLGALAAGNERSSNFNPPSPSQGNPPELP